MLHNFDPSSSCLKHSRTISSREKQAFHFTRDSPLGTRERTIIYGRPTRTQKVTPKIAEFETILGRHFQSFFFCYFSPFLSKKQKKIQWKRDCWCFVIRSIWNFRNFVKKDAISYENETNEWRLLKFLTNNVKTVKIFFQNTNKM